MKKLFFLFPFLFVACSSVRFVTTDHGQIVNQNNKPINIIGRPRITCSDLNGKIIADGYFVKQNDDGSFVIDEFGTGYVTVKNPYCKLSSNEY